MLAQGEPVVVTTKLWLSGTTAAQQASWHRYSLASFLLGTTGSSYFSFTASRGAAEIQTIRPLDHIDIGTPSGPYSLVTSAVYKRDYTGGTVFVNQGTGTVTFPVSGQCTTLDGALVTGSLTMPARTGEICR
jgi:hypothetical protein